MRGTAGRMAVGWRLGTGGTAPRDAARRRAGPSGCRGVPRPAGPVAGVGRVGLEEWGVGRQAANTKHGTRDYLTAVRLYFIREWIRPLAPLRMKVQVLVQV